MTVYLRLKSFSLSLVLLLILALSVFAQGGAGVYNTIDVYQELSNYGIYRHTYNGLNDAFRLNHTGPGGLLFDFRVNGSSKFLADRAGNTYIHGPLTTHLLGLKDNDRSHALVFKWSDDDDSDRVISWHVDSGHRSVTLKGDTIIDQDISSTANPRFNSVSLGSGSAKIWDGGIAFATITTPVPMPGYMQMYGKDDHGLYVLDDQGIEHYIAGQTPSFKSYTFRSKDPGSGIHYIGGFYDAPVTDANLNQTTPTITYGEINHPYAAHAFIVSGGNGSTDGTDLILTVSGTSMNSDGTRIESDSEVIEVTAIFSALDSYYETDLKWIGEITYTLTSVGGSAYNYDFCYGFAKYEDWGNRNYTITDFECTGNPNMNDSGFDIELLHHSAEGWTYDATAFSPGSIALYQMTTIHGVESDISADVPFAFKLTDQSHYVNSGNGEGTIIRITTGVNNAIFYINAHLGVNL